MITVIGIGIKKGQITEEAANEILASDAVVIRTNKSNAGMGASEFCQSKNIKPTFLDSLYNKAQDFNELDKLIEEKLSEKEAGNKRVAFLTDGDGLEDAIGEKLVKSGAKLISGISAHGGTGNKISAADLVEIKPHLNTQENLTVYNVDSLIAASDVKLFLFEFYGEETPVLVKSDLGEEIVPLYDVDKLKKFDYSVTFIIGKQNNLNKERFCFNDLMLIMKRLTDKNGCEWDKAQTHESILINLIEEAYEAVDAILSKDLDNMREEVGDVLLQAIFHGTIAERNSEFNTGDVITDLCAKLVSRHTHIFGEDNAINAEAALNFWEKAKAKEKSYESVSHQISLMPSNFPSLLKAEKVLKKAVKAGMTTSGDILSELVEAEKNSDIGRLLFLTTILANKEKKDAEVELIKEVNKFANKFSEIEKSGKLRDNSILDK